MAAEKLKTKRKAEAELQDTAPEKKHNKSADTLRQQQELQTIAQSLNESVSKQVCDLAIARFFFANDISERAIESPKWQRLAKALSKRPRGYKSPGRVRMGTELLDVLYKSAQDEATAVLKKDDGMNRTFTGDGASFASKVLVNILIHVLGSAPILVDVVPSLTGWCCCSSYIIRAIFIWLL